MKTKKFLIQCSLIVASISFPDFAHAWVGGGTNAPNDPDFPAKAIVRIGVPMNPNEPACTATRVDANILLTAAHCVGRFLSGSVALDINERMRGYHVVDVKHLGPLDGSDTATDMALLLFEPMHSAGLACPRAQPAYEKLILPLVQASSVISNPQEVSFGGYGAKSIKLTHNGEKVVIEARDNSRELSFGTTQCTQSPPKGTVLSQLKKLSTPISITATTHYEISDTVKITNDGKPIGYTGDSGSPAVQKDSQGNWVVTGVMSKLEVWTRDQKALNAKIKIEVPGQEPITVSLPKVSEAFLAEKTNSLDLPEIRSILSARGITDAKITRSFNLKQDNHFAPLQAPDAQQFLKNGLAELRAERAQKNLCPE